MQQKTLSQAAREMLAAVSQLSRNNSIDWMSPAFAPVALAHAELTDALELAAPSDELEKLAHRVAGLNPTAGEIGAGMLTQLVHSASCAIGRQRTTN